MKRTNLPGPETPILSKAVLEQERKMLLNLGNDITRVRDKSDLLFLFSKRIKSLFYFTHTIVTLIDYKDETYEPFLLDHDNSPIRDHPRYQEMVDARFPLNEPFIQAVLQADGPVSFLLEDIMDRPGSPTFLRVNYERGVREILMTRLMKEDKPMGFIHIYSDRPGTFTHEFKGVIKGIAPQLSGAVSNIIKNEEVLKKEREKSFLLDFSSALAAVRTKEEFSTTVRRFMTKLNPLHAYVIRKINDDGATLSAYVYDPGTTRIDPRDLSVMASTSFPINDGLHSRVLDSAIPLLFIVEMEIRRGNGVNYLQYWKRMGYKTLVGVRLRNGETNLGILWLGIAEVNIQVLQGICSQISVAMANIIANEQIVRKQEEQAFLLDFSHDITQVRTKAELQEAIFRVLDKTMNTQLAMIRVIDDDGVHLSPFMFDRTLFRNVPNYDEMKSTRITIEEPYTSRVLASPNGLVFNVEEELRDGNAYAKLWKTTGLKNMYGLPLRAGDKNIGTIWLLANRLSQLMVKGICSQISIAIANIQANEQLLAYKKQLEVENDYLKEQIRTIYNFTGIIGNGEAMQKVYHLMSIVAGSNTTVLVLGETGTGKELVARAIHLASPRKDKLMVKVNCAALPANLIESELFGHERGAFTGAIDRRIGKFELADQGTLFLDEIGEMPLEAQAKLLRVIQERELERLGGKQTIRVDVRLIAATNRNLSEEVRAGKFREDLYYRLNVFPIVVPPLRERAEDIEALVSLFVEKYSRTTGRKVLRVAPKAIQQLRAYTWPGNVRELEHLIERSVLLTVGDTLHEVEIPRGGVGSVHGGGGFGGGIGGSVHGGGGFGAAGGAVHGVGGLGGAVHGAGGASGGVGGAAGGVTGGVGGGVHGGGGFGGSVQGGGGITDAVHAAQLANRSLEEVERSYIIDVLRRCAGKISGAGGAAEILGVPGNTLHSKMKKLGITKADYFGAR